MDDKRQIIATLEEEFNRWEELLAGLVGLRQQPG